MSKVYEMIAFPVVVIAGDIMDMEGKERLVEVECSTVPQLLVAYAEAREYGYDFVEIIDDDGRNVMEG